MKQIVWASLLLALALLLMPLFFMPAQTVTSTADAAYEPPLPIKTEAPPSAASSPIPVPKAGADGEIRLTVLAGDELAETTMAEYLPHAVAAEMPASFHQEALKAQAIAARTYVLYCTRHENPKHPDADVCTDSGCCLACLDESQLRAAWGADYETNLETINAAVADTDGMLLTYSGEPILAAFHSSSAGKTENGEELWGKVPYLVCVSSPETGMDVPQYVTTVEVSAGDLRDTVHLIKPDAVFPEDAAAWLGEIERDESGRVKKAVISGTSLTGQELRSLFSLRSTAFTLEYSEGRFLFTVTGHGHGLGMSQYGANVMAKNGFSYTEILAHYYPQTKLQ